jgi:cytochrome c-type biogenesis protein CcmF
MSMHPGDQAQIEEYTLTYAGPRMEVDTEKRMVFADVDVTRNGHFVGRVSPAKFIYKSKIDTPSTEVARYITLKNDLYLVIGMVNPQTKVAAFQVHVNQLISFIWFGAGILILGALVAMWPDVVLEEAGAFSYVRAAASVATAVLFGFLLAGGSAQAYGSPPGAEVVGARASPPPSSQLEAPAPGAPAPP